MAGIFEQVAGEGGAVAEPGLFRDVEKMAGVLAVLGAILLVSIEPVTRLGTKLAAARAGEGRIGYVVPSEPTMADWLVCLAGVALTAVLYSILALQVRGVRAMLTVAGWLLFAAAAVFLAWQSKWEALFTPIATVLVSGIVQFAGHFRPWVREVLRGDGPRDPVERALANFALTGVCIGLGSVLTLALAIFVHPAATIAELRPVTGEPFDAWVYRSDGAGVLARRVDDGAPVWLPWGEVRAVGRVGAASSVVIGD